jgi:3-hydroxybutyryl-CoA dehydrogenase
MKIAVISGEPLIKEMETGPRRSGPAMEWVRVRRVEDLDGHRDASLYIDLDFTMDQGRIGQLRELLPVPVMINSVVHTLREIGQPFIRINAWPGFLERSIHELVAPDATTEKTIDTLYGQLDWQYRIVPDIPGMISGRILAMIINEAYYTLQDKISTRAEIDTAMKLGTNYPFGPFEWGERIGTEKIFQLLTKLSERDSRYLPARALAEAVREVT